MKVKKMNVLYKIAFGMSIACFGLLVVSIVAAYLYNEVTISVVIGASGCVSALAAIILVMLSKEKKKKEKAADDGSQPPQTESEPQPIEDSELKLVLTHINSDDII